MFRPRAGFVFIVVMALCAALGCGASFFASSNDGRLLVFVSVDPASADANRFPGGQVQFTARGTFNLSPTAVSPLTGIVWTIDHPAFAVMPDLGHAFIDQTGLASCAPGFVGILQVFATAPADSSRVMSAQNAIVGMAHMVCP
jgi:hypothetical protein